MLVLTRKLGEEVVIADDITVKVVSIDGEKIRLGFDAPRDVEIWRGEIQAARDDKRVAAP